MSEIDSRVNDKDAQIKKLEEGLEDSRIRIQQLEKELGNYRALKRGIFQSSKWSLKTSIHILTGDLLYEKTQGLWIALSQWFRTGSPASLESAARDFTSALLVRLVRISLVGILIALLPILTVIIQTGLLYKQNQIVEQQGHQMAQQNALLSFEQSTSFHQILQSPEGKKPNAKGVNLILLLGEQSPDIVVNALKPLLYDKNPTVKGGAFISIQKLLSHPDDSISKKAFGALYTEKFWQENNARLTLNLSETDFTETHLEGAICNDLILAETLFHRTFLSKANFSNSVIDSVEFSSASLDKANFKHARMSQARFDHCELEGAIFDNVTFYPYVEGKKAPGYYEVRNSTGSGKIIWGDSVSFTHSNLTNASFWGVMFGDATFKDVRLFKANFGRSDLSDAYLINDYGDKCPITPEYLRTAGAYFDNYTWFNKH